MDLSFTQGEAVARARASDHFDLSARRGSRRSIRPQVGSIALDSACSHWIDRRDGSRHRARVCSAQLAHFAASRRSVAETAGNADAAVRFSMFEYIDMENGPQFGERGGDGDYLAVSLRVIDRRARRPA